MATIYLLSKLQDIVYTGLTATSPASTTFNTYKSLAYDRPDAIDPNKYPAIVVSMPREVSSESLAQATTRGECEIPLFVYLSEQDADDLDSNAAQYVAVIRTVLASYYPSGLQALGAFPGAWTLSEDEWVSVGQDTVRRVVFTIAVHYNPTVTLDG